MADNGEDSSEETLAAAVKDEQSPEERRQIRAKYRKILEECQDNKEMLIDPNSGDLLKKLIEADETFEKVSSSREGAHDAKVLALISSLGRQKIQNVQVDTFQFKSSEFVDRIFEYVVANGSANFVIRDDAEQRRMTEECWTSLGKATQSFFHRSPAFHCMLGTLEHGPSQPRERRPRSRVKDEASDSRSKTLVKEMTNEERTTAAIESTSNDVALRVHPALKRAFNRNRKKPIDYYAFVVNPNSFGQTVENIFHVSFLVRDGRAGLGVDSEGTPIIWPIKDGEYDAMGGVQNAPKRQLVMKLTMDIWRQLVEILDIQEPMIPPRQQEPTVSNSDPRQADTTNPRDCSENGNKEHSSNGMPKKKKAKQR